MKSPLPSRFISTSTRVGSGANDQTRVPAGHIGFDRLALLSGCGWRRFFTRFVASCVMLALNLRLGVARHDRFQARRTNRHVSCPFAIATNPSSPARSS
jgi:hypothetical protein